MNLLIFQDWGRHESPPSFGSPYPLPHVLHKYLLCKYYICRYLYQRGCTCTIECYQFQLGWVSQSGIYKINQAQLHHVVCTMKWCVIFMFFFLSNIVTCIASVYLAHKHGLRTPNEAFSHGNTKLLGLGRQIGQINSGAFGVFSADLLAPILVQ